MNLEGSVNHQVNILVHGTDDILLINLEMNAFILARWIEENEGVTPL